MRVIKPSYEILTPIDGGSICEDIEIIGRVCYKSENKITEDSAGKFVKMLIDRGHEAMIEHHSITVKIICDRGISHELVRHRIASYAQESTRYCNYSKNNFNNELTFILPNWFPEDIPDGFYSFGIDNAHIHYTSNNTHNALEVSNINCQDWNNPDILWLRHMLWSEKTYLKLIRDGWKAEEARDVLPNSLKTEIVITMNLREWRHFFKLRCTNAAHPQMREMTIPMFEEFKILLPEFFEDINPLPEF
jgi:thymidylate synthase (FAD)